MTKKWFIPLIIIILISSIWIIWHKYTFTADTIKMGILHSLSGDLAISEKPVADATLLAIKEINDAGGVLGKKIEPILVDGQSNAQIFAQKAEELITKNNVAVIFGGWTSPSRIAIKNIVEKYNNLFVVLFKYF